MNRRYLLKTAGAVGAASILGSGPVSAKAAELNQKKRGRKKVKVKARQQAGKRTHWVLPGPRRLDPALFGTPEAGESSPQLGIDHIQHKIWALREDDNPAAGLLAGDDGYEWFPIPVGWPEGPRGTNDDKTEYTKTKMPLPFSDNTVGSDENDKVDGMLDLTYIDRQGFEGDGKRNDEIKLDVWFTDPAGNKYELEIDELEHHDGAHPHGRGVMTGAYLHGSTGIGTPLMPTEYAFGSFWGVGSLRINGNEPLEQNTKRLVHFMTTQNVRKDDYTLAIDSELPLGADAYLGRSTQTHGILGPVRMTDEGPRKVSLETAFDLSKDEEEEKLQPFVHFMWDEDEVQFD